MFVAVYVVGTEEAVDDVGGDITARAISRWDSAPMSLMFLVAPIKYDMRNNLNEKGFVFFSQFMTETSWQQELESFCHITSTLKSQRAMDTLIQLAFLILHSLWPGFGKNLFWGESSYLP